MVRAPKWLNVGCNHGHTMISDPQTYPQIMPQPMVVPPPQPMVVPPISTVEKNSEAISKYTITFGITSLLLSASTLFFLFAFIGAENTDAEFGGTGTLSTDELSITYFATHLCDAVEIQYVDYYGNSQTLFDDGFGDFFTIYSGTVSKGDSFYLRLTVTNLGDSWCLGVLTISIKINGGDYLYAEKSEPLFDDGESETISATYIHRG